MTRDQAKAWLIRYDDLDEDNALLRCHRGHPRCSDEEGGTCLDDVAEEFPDLV